ncbi:hydroxyacylglutathione hydrolase [Sphingomonas sp. PB2P19]|uniref:hydroxyacylglutathione hydrolase n=1 Tax=Sphingomonas rhamnosi TaxID=3096156 RepID=UPI002FC5D61C
MLEIVRVPVLADNYAWLVHDDAGGETVAVDPGEAAPVIAAAEARGWRIAQVWTTHWHGDHTGGNDAMKAYGATVTGPAAEAERIPTLDTGVGEGDTVRIGDHVAQVMTVPGHTAGHIAFHFAEDGAIFTGDTLFAMGCGRLFEGTPAEMFANMQRYATLPDDTRVYCGHEYTQSNGRYALVAEPDNAAVAARMVEVDALRARGEATIPTTIGLERQTNPFLRAASAEELSARRQAKDSFRG